MNANPFSSWSRLTVALTLAWMLGLQVSAHADPVTAEESGAPGVPPPGMEAPDVATGASPDAAPAAPADTQALNDCASLDLQMRRYQSAMAPMALVQASPYPYAYYPSNTLVMGLQQNLVALQSRWNDLGCSQTVDASAGSAGAEARFDACFTRCQQYTKRTQEQCFDACNR